jgi:hypothetical protein
MQAAFFRGTTNRQFDNKWQLVSPEKSTINLLKTGFPHNSLRPLEYGHNLIRKSADQYLTSRNQSLIGVKLRRLDIGDE